ncbi:MAG: hypothetical protein Q4F84_01120 [Fibrobacter sp.]|nr:hypothetical protein [Fibrobacter sp.]
MIQENATAEEIAEFEKIALGNHPMWANDIGAHYNCCNWQTACAYAFYYGYLYGREQEV